MSSQNNQSPHEPTAAASKPTSTLTWCKRGLVGIAWCIGEFSRVRTPKQHRVVGALKLRLLSHGRGACRRAGPSAVCVVGMREFIRGRGVTTPLLTFSNPS
jgi:hypothetical protein